MAALAGDAAVPAVYTISLFSGKVAGSWARAATVGTGMPRVMSFMSTVMPFFSKASSSSLSTGSSTDEGSMVGISGALRSVTALTWRSTSSAAPWRMDSS